MTGRDAVVATYELAGGFPLEELARVVGMEQSTGTWTPVAKRAGSLEDRLAAWVVDTDEATGRARIAFPLEIFEPENIAGVLSIVAGNLFGLGSLTRARWVDIEFPDAFTRRFPGPGFGIDGIRAAVGTTDSGRPHGGTIVKPKVGLDPAGTAARCKEAALGGLDLIKDDETLTDQPFCSLADRTPAVLSALDESYDETGHRTLYAVNLTAGADEVLRRWDTVRDAGADCVMIDILTAGFDALLALRKECTVPIHCHRTMHGALTRGQDFGIDMMAVARLTRLCGGDQLHVGTATGKMGHEADPVALASALRDDWHGMKPLFPVSSGGLHPASVPGEVAVYGPDVVLQAGGGIHGHPGGTTAGAKAFMQAIEATHAGRRLEDETAPELQAALRRWGDERYQYTA